MVATFQAPDIAVIAVGAAACVTDLRSRRIPNVLTFGASVAAVAFGAVTGGPAGAGWSVAGWAVGCAVFMPWFLLGGMGAGDVKLLAALGAWVGPSAAVWMALYAGIAGGVFAVGVSLARGYLKEMFINVWDLLMFWRIAGVQPHPEITLRTGKGPRLPYAVPITVGAAAVLWLK
jgi:prepilin peptidase CpaA